jgi:glycosyltransferase involved in cell wall biosynthesis
LKAKYSKANIKFLGHVSPPEVKELVINAKMLVLPSECYENNPLSVIEALSLGTPVVGAKIGGIPELLKPSNGVLFRSGDVDSLEKSIRMVWNTDYNYKEISQKSIEVFSKERYFKEIMTAYGIS